jgi:hypothetical protein
MEEVTKIPLEYIGKKTTNGGYTKETPRKWTEKEIEWCLEMKKKGYSSKDIAKSVDRSQVSVSIKLKRISKKQKTYNRFHITEKYEYNQKFVERIQPKSILDVYAGDGSFYEGAVSNDTNLEFNVDYHMDAQKFVCKMFLEGNKYDLIDLDPFGSAYDCFHLAIQMAKKGIVITFGEIGHKRWKRLDFVRNHYNIQTMEDFTTENIIKEIQRIGLMYKKTITPVFIGEWNRISRVYFKIETYKITEQWNKK